MTSTSEWSDVAPPHIPDDVNNAAERYYDRMAEICKYSLGDEWYDMADEWIDETIAMGVAYAVSSIPEFDTTTPYGIHRH